MDLGVPKVPVPIHFVREHFVFADPEGPDTDEPPTNVDREEWWKPAATRAAQEYIEALQVVMELYHRDEEHTHRVWIETRIRS